MAPACAHAFAPAKNLEQRLIELISLPNQLFRGYQAMDKRTNQPHVTALHFILTGDSNTSLTQHNSLGFASYFILLTCLGVMPGI